MDVTSESQSLKGGSRQTQDVAKKKSPNKDKKDGHRTGDTKRTPPAPFAEDNFCPKPSANTKDPATSYPFTTFSSSPSRRWSKSEEHPTPTIKLTQALRQYPEQLKLPDDLVGKPISYKPVDLWAKEILPSAPSKLPISSFSLGGPVGATVHNSARSPANYFKTNHERSYDSTLGGPIHELPSSSQPCDLKEHDGDLTSIGPSSSRNIIVRVAKIPESQVGNKAVAEAINGRPMKQFLTGNVIEVDHRPVTQPRDKIPLDTTDTSSSKKAPTSTKPGTGFTDKDRQIQAGKLRNGWGFKAEDDNGGKTTAKWKGKKRRRSFEEEDDHAVPVIDDMNIPPEQNNYRTANSGRSVRKDAALEWRRNQEAIRTQGYYDPEEDKAKREDYQSRKEDRRRKDKKDHLAGHLAFKGNQRGYNGQLLSEREASLERAEEEELKRTQTFIESPCRVPTAEDLRNSMDDFLKDQGQKNRKDFDGYINSKVQENERNLLAGSWDLDRMMAEARMPVARRESHGQRHARQQAARSTIKVKVEKEWVSNNAICEKQALRGIGSKNTPPDNANEETNSSKIRDYQYLVTPDALPATKVQSPDSGVELDGRLPSVDDASSLTSLSRATTPPDPFHSASSPEADEMDINISEDEVGDENDDESESSDSHSLDNDQNDLYVPEDDIDNESDHSGALSENESPIWPSPGGDQTYSNISDNEFDSDNDGGGGVRTQALEDLDFPGLTRGSVNAHATDNKSGLSSIRTPSLDQDVLVPTAEEWGLNVMGVQGGLASSSRFALGADAGHVDMDSADDEHELPSTGHRDQRPHHAMLDQSFSTDTIGGGVEFSSIRQADYSSPYPPSRPGSGVVTSRGHQHVTNNEAEMPTGPRRQFPSQRGSFHSEINWRDSPNRGRGSQPRPFQPPRTPRARTHHSQLMSRPNSSSFRSEGNSPSSPYRGRASQSGSFRPPRAHRTHIRYSQLTSRLTTGSFRSEGNSSSSPYRGRYSRSGSLRPVSSWRRTGAHIDRTRGTTSDNGVRTPRGVGYRPSYSQLASTELRSGAYDNQSHLARTDNRVGLQWDIRAQSHSLPGSGFSSTPVRNQNPRNIHSPRSTPSRNRNPRNIYPSPRPQLSSERRPPEYRHRDGERNNSSEGLSYTPGRNPNSRNINSSPWQHSAYERGSPDHNDSGGERNSRGRYSNPNERLELFPHLSSDRGSPSSRAERGGEGRGANPNRGRELLSHLRSDRGSPRSWGRGDGRDRGSRRGRQSQSQRYREPNLFADEDLFRGFER